MAMAQNAYSHDGNETLPSTGNLKEGMVVRGVAEEPLKFRVFSARDLTLVGEAGHSGDSNPGLISLPPFIDLSQVLQPL